jgi:O-antigen ligase
MLEANVFGSLSGASLVLGFGCLAVSASNRSRRALIGGLVVLSVACVLSLSRGAWVGCLAGLAVLFLYRVDIRHRAPAVVMAILVAGTGLVVLGTSSPPVSARLSTFGDLLNGQVDGNLQERIYTYAIAVTDWQQHPLFGLGAGSLGQLHDYSTQALPAWVGNLEIHALHDAGIVGLGALLFCLGGIAFLVHKRWRDAAMEERALKGVLGGLLGAMVSLIVSFQATEATWLAYSWVFFGLALSGGLIARTGSERPAHLKN